MSDTPTDAPPTEHEAVAQDAWRQAAELLAGGTHRLVVLDESTYPTNWCWIDADEVVDAIAHRSPKVNVSCTGRDAPAALVDVADTATEMRQLKHAYDSGIRATKGIDY